MDLNKLSIRWRITLGMLLILLLALLSAGNLFIRNITIKYETREVANSWIPAIENLGDMKDVLSEHFLTVTDRLGGRNTDDPAVFAGRLKALEDDLAHKTDIYAATLESYLPGDPQADQEKAIYAQYQQARGAYFEAVKSALGASSGDVSAPFRGALQHADAILAFNLAGTAKAALKSHDLVASAELTMLLATAALVGISLLLIWWIPNSVVRPVQEAVAVARRIAAGDLSQPVQTGRGDELGTLLRSLDDFLRHDFWWYHHEEVHIGGKVGQNLRADPTRKKGDNGYVFA